MILGFRFSFSGTPLAGYLLFARFVRTPRATRCAIAPFPVYRLSENLGPTSKFVTGCDTGAS